MNTEKIIKELEEEAEQETDAGFLRRFGSWYADRGGLGDAYIAARFLKIAGKLEGK